LALLIGQHALILFGIKKELAALSSCQPFIRTYSGVSNRLFKARCAKFVSDLLEKKKMIFSKNI
jgi:hypothetical protein